MRNNYQIFTHDQLVKDGKELKLSIYTTSKEVDFLLSILDIEVRKKDPSFNLLRQTCYQLVCRLPLPIHYYRDTFMLRARPNYNGEMFSWSSEISYNSQCPERCELGRFNLAKESVFYGTAPIDSEQANGALTTICEAYKDMYDVTNLTETQYLTLGKWTVTSAIPLIMLTFYEEAWRKSIHIQNINVPYVDFLLRAFDEQDRNKCIAFFAFLSEHAGRRNDSKSSYLLTTAFFYAMQMYYGSEIGILYSSAMTENFGLNIVLTKEAADRHLKLDSALMYRVDKNLSNPKSVKLYPCTEQAFADKKGRFRIQRPPNY